MAEWKYRTHRIELRPDANLEDQLESVLHDFGTEGWELVQVLPRSKAPGDPDYLLIFKTEKPLTDIQEN